MARTATTTNITFGRPAAGSVEACEALVGRTLTLHGTTAVVQEFWQGQFILRVPALPHMGAAFITPAEVVEAVGLYEAARLNLV